jgi:DNA polymerase-3 subunit alpha
MSDIKKMVATAVGNGQPALALTDHGLMSGSFQLYKECKKAGILPFPGEEFYIVHDVNDKTAPRYHVGMFALSHEGYKSLVWLSSLSYRRDRFHHKPRIDFQDLAKMANDGLFRDVALTTGCYFGLLAQTLITKGHKAACAIARSYATWCPNTYVEIQHHNTPHDEQWDDTALAEALLAVADDVGLPVIVTQDSHYCDHSDKELHDFYKRIAYAGSTTDDGFPGDSYHLADVKWMKDHFGSTKDLRRIWNEGLDSCETLVNQHRLALPALDTYKFQMPVWSKSADADLRKRCGRILRLRIPAKDRAVYEDRLKYELDVIKDAGFASYFLLVGDSVAKGQRLVVLEAMKMQHELTAPAAGRLAEVAVQPGDQVATRQLHAFVEAR